MQVAAGDDRPRYLSSLSADLSRLRIVSIVLPVAFLIVVDAARHLVWPGFWHSTAGAAVVYGATGTAVTAFAFTVFAILERLEDQRARQTLWIASLQQLANSTSARLDLDVTVATGLEGVLRAVGADAGVVCRVFPEKWEHSAICTQGLTHGLEAEIQRAKLQDDPVAERAVATGRPVMFREVFDDARVRDAAAREGIQDGMSVPLTANGVVNGIIAVAFRRPHEFSDDEREFLLSAGRQLGLALHNATLYEQSTHQNQTLSALLAVSEVLSTSADVAELASRVLPVVLEVSGSDSCELWLSGEGGPVLQRHEGAPGGAHTLPERAGMAAEIMAEALETGKVQVRSSLAARDDGGRVPAAPEETAPGSLVAVPISSRGRVLGVLMVGARDTERAMTPESLRVLAEIADRIGPALENAELRAQLQHHAVLEERERISREMHDGLAQILGYVNTQALAVRKLLMDGATEQAVSEIGRLRTAAREAYADVREGILALRTSSSAGGGAISGLEEYIERYHDMFDLPVDLDATPEARSVSLPMGVDLQVVRIVQEALSNVRRHARASCVQVRCAVVDGDLQIDVIDDGVGFATGRPPAGGRPRFGLQTMEERARSVGGLFTISSAAGRGTHVCVRVPVDDPAAVLG